MDLADLAIVIAVLMAAGSGFERGFWLTLTTYGGALLGLVAGAALAPGVSSLVTQPGSSLRPFMEVLALAFFGTLGSSVGFAVGEPIRRRILRGREGAKLDTLAGVILSIGAILAAAWFIGLTFSRSQFTPLTQQIQNSAVLRTLDGVAPRPPGFLTRVEQELAGVDFPQVFAGLAPPSSDQVTLDPGAADSPAVHRAALETVKVVSEGCGGLLEGSGFPVATDYILTNAHVVAGGSGTSVQIPGRASRTATVVLFDKDRDVAILHVSGLGLDPLPRTSGSRGTSGAVIGYPGGGKLTAGPAAVRQRVNAQGRDIYGVDLVTRSVFILQARVIPGNSGGPLVTTAGEMVGVVFAASTSDSSEAYALTSEEVAPDIAAGTGRRAAVSTQDCAE